MNAEKMFIIYRN